MKNKPTKSEIDEFLSESNAIEGVFDEDSFKQAKEAWKYLIKQKTLTKDVVLKTHKILMLNQNIQPDEKGYFRKCEVTIGGRYGLNWIKIPLVLEEWLVDVATSINIPGENGRNIKLDHIEYEYIHPFVDGNGRTGRMFYNWQRLKSGLPLHIIHEGPEQFEYYKWFK
jgi:Fic family protein